MGFDVPDEDPREAAREAVRDATRYASSGLLDVGDLDLVTEVEEQDPEGPHLADVWVGAVLAVTVLGCLLCICSCLVHHALRRWRDRVLQAAAAEVQADLEANSAGAASSPSSPSSPLPSYTLVSGLPTYDEALDQLQQRRQLRRSSSAQRAIEAAVAAARAAGNLAAVRRLQFIRQLSVGELIQYSFRSNSFDKS